MASHEKVIATENFEIEYFLYLYLGKSINKNQCMRQNGSLC